jgi:hypothetical protein
MKSRQADRDAEVRDARPDDARAIAETRVASWRAIG